MNCLWCHEEIIPEITWSNLFQPVSQIPFCTECERELKGLEGPQCQRCGRLTSEKLCADCRSWGNGTTDLLEFNHSIFTYNKMMQDIITKWKYRGDYILGNIFKSYVIEAFKIRFAFLEKDFVAIPIPLSEERMKERGFNQAQVLAEFLPVQHADILTRKHGIKQSKRTRMERISAENPFFIGQHINNPVILVDDIYTTGTTLRHAARLLKEHGCPEIYAFTLIRG